MVAPLRTTTQVRDDLATARHLAGRMTCVDPEYGPLHEEINALLDELAMLERAT